MAKDAYWFPHDAGARNDPKVVRLRRIHGHAGVGAFWYVIEMLRESNEDDYEMPLDCIEDVAYEARFEESIFNTLFEVGLLQKDDTVFWSESLKRRMQPLDERRRRLSEAGKRGGRPPKKKGGLKEAKARLKPGRSQVKATPKGGPKPTESNKRRSEEIRGDQSKSENEDLLPSGKTGGQELKGKRPKSADTWNAYCEAFRQRYGTFPPHDKAKDTITWPYGKPAQMNATHCCQLVDKLGSDVAPHVASFYVTTSNSFYAQRNHQLNLLVSNADSFHTQWKTGRQTTQAGAREGDRLQKTGQAWAKTIAKHEAKEAAKNGN